MNKLVVFVAGAAIGSLVTWKLVKAKYEQIANEEIESVKEVFQKRYSEKFILNETQSEPNGDTETDPEAVKAYNELLEKLKYANIDVDELLTKKGGSTVIDKPFVISPEEFGEDPNYATESLTLYADGVLTNEADEIIDDIEDLVGEDSLTHFGEYEDDSVFVRNDNLQTDFEILRDLDTYKETHPDQGDD